MRKRLALYLLATTLASLPAFGGEVLYQKAFGGGVKKPATFSETVTLPTGKEPYILNLVNGSPDGQHRLSSLTVSFDNQPVAGPTDLSQETEAINRGITPSATNRLSLTLRGSTDGFVTVRILGGVASPSTPPPSGAHNVTQSNADSSLSGLNMGESVVLWFDPQPGAALYVLSAAASPDGPWQEIQHLDGASLPPGKNPSTVDFGASTDTGQPRADNDDFRGATTYYRMQALDATSAVVKDYAAIAVPPYVEEKASGAASKKLANPFAGVTGKAATACGGPCIQDQPFIKDSDFTNNGTMNLDQIRQLLSDRNSFLQGNNTHQIADVDGQLIDPGQLINDAAQNNNINPQVILATLQKESSAITSSTRPGDTRLKNLAGFGSPSMIRDQITDLGAQLRRDYDRLEAGGSTLGGWKPGADKQTLDGKTVCPGDISTAILYTYTPYIGAGWGGQYGGNALFFDIYYGTLGFGQKPLFCGIYGFAAAAPTGDVQTRKPKLSIQVNAGASCNSTYTLTLDGAQVASGSLAGGGGAVSFAVTTDLSFGRHRARVTVKSTECGTSSSRSWSFKVKKGKKIAMVIDDTGSMGDEIDAVKGALANFITSQTSQPNSPDIEWTLVTFKDGVSVRGTTTDAAIIQGQVASLYADGGDDCPEESLGALNTAASLISGDDEFTRSIIFATDASPHGGTGDVSATIAAMQAGGIPVNTLLTGDCVDTAIAAAAPTAKVIAKDYVILSARQVFSQISEQTGGLYFFLPGASVEDLTDALDKIFEVAGGGGTDTTPPTLTLEVSPSVLKPADHQMVEIAPILTVSDNLDPNPGVELLSVVSSEPEDGQGSGNTPGDIVTTEDGRIFVRAERSGTGSSRVYTITYRATDAAGNSTTASADVRVPHDNR